MTSIDFLIVLFNSKGIIGNSSVAIRECSFLGIPAVNIGTRQTGRERGQNVIDVDYDRYEIEKAIRYHLKSGKNSGESIYGDGCTGEKIATILAEVELKSEKCLAY